ncbi:MAG: FeoA family protein [Almyronema sp.]
MLVGFTLSGASLQTLSIGEQGIIARFTQADAYTLAQLQAIGLEPGTAITLEQRHPKFVVKTASGRLALTAQMVRAIYVRLPSDRPTVLQAS